MNEMNEILPISNPNPAALFAPGGLTAILDQIEQQARSIVPDISTAGGRKEVASVAHRIARSKTYLDGLGKDFVADLKKTTAAVDAERKAMRDRLDSLKDEVRRPLTEWEQAEESRRARHQSILAELEAVTANPAPHGVSSEAVADRLAEVDRMEFGPECGDDVSALEAQKARAITALAGALEHVKQAEVQRAELERLRLAEAEREAQAAAQAAEMARQAREAQVAAEAADRARIAAERAAAEAVRRAEQAEADARRAVEEERQRAVRTEAEAREAAARAEAERRDRAEVIEAAVAGLVEYAGLTAEQADHAVEAIAAGSVPFTTINFGRSA